MARVVDQELIGADGEALADLRVDAGAVPLPRVRVLPRPGASSSALAEALRERFAGHRLAVRDPGLADALIERRVPLDRASWLMTLTLPAAVPADPDADIRPLRDAALEYGEVVWRAYPPGHPDHDMLEDSPAAAGGTVARYLSGEIVGPLLRAASCEAWSADGALAGFCVISRLPADDEFAGGAWVTDVCVTPDAQGQGLGRAMLAHAIGRLGADGEPSLGLAVTRGSPARPLYDALGFVERLASWTFDLD